MHQVGHVIQGVVSKEAKLRHGFKTPPPNPSLLDGIPSQPETLSVSLESHQLISTL